MYNASSLNVYSKVESMELYFPSNYTLVTQEERNNINVENNKNFFILKMNFSLFISL